VHDETDVLEDAQVLRDRGPAHGQRGGELSDGPWAAAEELEHLPPGAVTERVERMSVSVHLP
jgi:hypothetical protein